MPKLEAFLRSRTMNHLKSLVFHSMAGDFCHQCGRSTRLRCVSCNPMHYVCCHCLESHASAHRQMPVDAQPESAATELAVAS